MSTITTLSTDERPSRVSERDGELVSPGTVDVSRQFADFARSARYEDLPAGAVDAAKKTIVDSLAVMLAASGDENATRAVVDMVREMGGREEASVFGFGFRAPAMLAAMANGAAMHSLNFDDYLPWGQHCSLSLVPAVLAAAERMERVPGTELITAIAVGQDLFARLRCNVSWKKDWNLSTAMGAVSAAAAAGRVLGLDGRQINHAMAIASSEAGGVMEVVSGLGSDLGGIYGAFPAKTAVMAAQLADRGVKGTDTFLEGVSGVFAAFFSMGYDRDAMLADLGREFEGAHTLYKRWPAIGTAHSHIHAVIQAIQLHSLDVSTIRELKLFVGDAHELLCVPLNERRVPATVLDARFSLPFLVALAAVRGNVSVRDLNGHSLKDPAVRALAARVTVSRDPSLDWKSKLPDGRIEITLVDGRQLIQGGEGVPGSPQHPLSWADLRQKFGECASVAATPLDDAQVDDLFDRVTRLEELHEAVELTSTVAGA
ncbi:MmgE/PrpD family protein [Nocardioides pocheonensis]|uniref:MmgE/PrpD family protein n=1 Tax=Nocardioides pocheonensis TaxID=661485 RepID=A0A3N0GI65_9ACTN|nr:MmgE/PrpD family protein [Nocardioides pocheonensis]RNM12165.1 MmgE/PrpD family protein [Nocardioides pocheonensis]